MRIPKRLASLAAVGIAGALALAACGGGDNGDNGEGQQGETAAPSFEDCVEDPVNCNSGPAQQGGEIHWVINSNSDGWNTSRAATNSVYATQAVAGVYPSLITVHPDASFDWNMDLLESTPEVISEDPHAWTYTIKEGAIWDDGTQINVNDMRFAWQMLTGDTFGECVGCDSASTARAHQVESIEGSDDGRTITVTLREGESNPEWEFFGGFAPAHIVEAEGFDLSDPEDVGRASEWLNNNVPTFSGGPWKIVEGDLNNQVIMEPNENWYGEPVNLDTIIKMYNDNEGSWVQAMQTGEIHGASPSATFPEDVIRQLQGQDGVMVGLQSGMGWEHMDVNLGNSQLQDHDLRRAIFTAIDSQEMATRLYGEIFPEIATSGNYIFRTFSPYYQDLTEGTGFGTGDAEAALGILEDAGYTLDGDTLTLDGEQVGPFRLRSTATSVRQNAVQMIQAYLSDIGVEIIIEHTDNLGETLAEADYDLMLFGWSGSPTFASFPGQMLRSDSGSNFGGYDNPQVDELVDAAASSLTLEEAAEHANQAAKIALDDAYVLPLFETPDFIFASDKYINIRDNVAMGARAAYDDYAQWGLAVVE